MARRLRMIDLFCGAGGCSVGYARAAAALGIELEIVGVDHVRMDAYPYTFVHGDAMTHPLDGFDFVHASPPCKVHTVLHHRWKGAPTLFEPHVDLLAPTFDRLRSWGGVWVVENVPGAPMPPGTVTLCGSAFGLRVRRHRLFASSVPLQGSVCDHKAQGNVVGVYGTGGAWTRDKSGGGGVKVAGPEAAAALGIDWTDQQRALSQAIPPAYTEHLGLQLFA